MNAASNLERLESSRSVKLRTRRCGTSLKHDLNGKMVCDRFDRLFESCRLEVGVRGEDFSAVEATMRRV